MGALAIVFGIIGSGIVGVIVDLTHFYKLALIICLALGTGVYPYWPTTWYLKPPLSLILRFCDHGNIIAVRWKLYSAVHRHCTPRTVRNSRLVNRALQQRTKLCRSLHFFFSPARIVGAWMWDVLSSGRSYPYRVFVGWWPNRRYRIGISLGLVDRWRSATHCWLCCCRLYCSCWSPHLRHVPTHEKEGIRASTPPSSIFPNDHTQRLREGKWGLYFLFKTIYLSISICLVFHFCSKNVCRFVVVHYGRIC